MHLITFKYYKVRSCNALFITLIPKEKGTIELRNYRPISPIGTVYKIAAKVLAERIKKVIGKLASGHKNAFIKNMQITDETLIANEVLDWRLKSGAPGILCKLKVEKAFDQNEWFISLDDVNEDGAWGKMDKVDKVQHHYSKIIVLVNRSPVGSSLHKTNLDRGGSPLSLFSNSSNKDLSKMLDKAKQLQWIKGFEAESSSGDIQFLICI